MPPSERSEVDIPGLQVRVPPPFSSSVCSEVDIRISPPRGCCTGASVTPQHHTHPAPCPDPQLRVKHARVIRGALARTCPPAAPPEERCAYPDLYCECVPLPRSSSISGLPTILRRAIVCRMPLVRSALPYRMPPHSARVTRPRVHAEPRPSPPALRLLPAALLLAPGSNILPARYQQVHPRNVLPCLLGSMDPRCGAVRRNQQASGRHPCSSCSPSTPAPPSRADILLCMSRALSVARLRLCRGGEDAEERRDPVFRWKRRAEQALRLQKNCKGGRESTRGPPPHY
ncbi:hypothetical protein T484DRAFT_1976245 [Baffinella frigidus]|nr:hypothetical protein T484DRAFT_1976245 [Cryptophyta sp. CCMP2293]